MKKLLAAGIAGLLLAGTATMASAAKPEDAVKYRQGAFQVIKWNFGPLVGMAKGEVPYDAAKAAHHAELLALMSKEPWAGFTADSAKVDSDTKPEAWSQADKFKEHQQAFEAAADKLLAAAKTGDAGALKPAVGEVGKSCKACHDAFRKD
ncbi:c-type cytochrome [Plasticicumulans acidivorans]|uniref:Cytochrome c556 n=1 Tax=Plasticicumulans acidivorans TaxID=886464 RepID=A0A317MQC8_9GAMM|nr:cytochrome c [Plasticicumulans acidivorans]PWV58844.1 cytochrome c556 [Plasticicumulans acidivorans]